MVRLNPCGLSGKYRAFGCSTRDIRNMRRDVDEYVAKPETKRMLAMMAKDLDTFTKPIPADGRSPGESFQVCVCCTL